MSDPVATTTETTITVDQQAPKPVPAAASPAAPPAPASSTEPDEKPTWLTARLERERAKVLKDLGVESIDDAKQALADLNAKREAEKTATQKAIEAEQSLKTTRAERDDLAAALGTYAKAQMSGLSEEQRAAVVALAGEDPAKQVKAIEALAPTWKAAAPAAAAAKSEAPTDTAPPPTSPKDGPALSPADPKAVYAELKKTNPVIAARYAVENGVHDSQ